MITIAEMQVGYVVALVGRLARHRLGSVEVRPEVAEEYNRRVDATHAGMIWMHPAMTNWYRNAAGRVVNTLAVADRRLPEQLADAYVELAVGGLLHAHLGT